MARDDRQYSSLGKLRKYIKDKQGKSVETRLEV